jgi:hypothetical protein
MALDEGRRTEQPDPAVDHLVLAPDGGGSVLHVEDQVVMVTHHRMGEFYECPAVVGAADLAAQRRQMTPPKTATTAAQSNHFDQISMVP